MSSTLRPFTFLVLPALLVSACSTSHGEVVAATPADPSGATLFAPEATPAERVIELGRHDNRAQEHLRHLTLAIGPRLTASHSLMEAETWCRDQFASWGLDARLEPWGEFPVGFDRGPWSGSMVAPRLVEFVFTTPAWTPGTHGPVRAPAKLLPTGEGELEGALEGLAGAWVVQPRGGRMSREQRAELNAALVQAGAAGLISAARGEELVHTGGRSNVDWDDLPKLTSVVLRGDQHADLVERLEKEEAVELEFDIDNRFFEGPVTLNNVVADLVGSEKPDEYVIVCGHLDSWDGALGTVDNGTGCSTTLEAARLLVAAGVQPRRTIRFILWSGEEQGLLGSRAYVAANEDILPRVSAVLNHDGGTNYLSGLGVTAEMMPAMIEACAPLTDLNPDMSFALNELDSLPGGGSSDHASFVRAGVPGFFWRQAGRSDYNRHHHTQYDTFDAAIPAYQEHSSIVAATVALNLANQDELLERKNMAPVPPRRMGARLDGMAVRSVSDDSLAAKAGWQAGDVIVSLDGEPMADRRALQRALQSGPPRKVFVLRRGEEELESVLDWSDDPGEEERVRRAAERAKG